MEKKKLIRLTTIDLSLDKLIRGQLRYLNDYFDVVGVSADTGLLRGVAEREGIRVVEVPMHREISLVNDLRSLWQLIRLFRKEKPYILHCNTPKGSLLGLLAGKIVGIPHRIYTVTGLRYQGAHGKLRWLLKNMERMSCACATKVIPEGQGVLHTLQKDNITRKPLRVLHYGNINGIDTEVYNCETLAGELGLTTDEIDETKEFAVEGNCNQTTAEVNGHNGRETVYSHRVSSLMRKKLGLAADDFVFVFVGRIVKDKGINELVNCMRKLNCKLVLVGSFDADDPIDSANAEYLKSSPNVVSVGWQEDVRPYLVAADALVFPSYREGFPNVPIQAGALGVPAIVTKINGCDEIVKDGLNGRIIAGALENGAEAMETALYNTMKWFVEHPEEVRRMSRNCRELVTSRYEQRDVWEAILGMYRELGRF